MISENQSKSDCSSLSISNSEFEDQTTEQLYTDFQPDTLSDKELRRYIKELKIKISQNDSDFSVWEMHPQILSQQDSQTGTYLIHYACEYGNYRFLEAMRQYNGDSFLFDQCKLQSKSGRTAIHFAAQSLEKRVLAIILKVLQKQSADELEYQINLKELRNRNNVLQIVLLNPRKKEASKVNQCFRLLSKHCKKKLFLERNSVMLNALDISVQKGYVDILSQILTIDKEISQYTDMNRNNFLHLAAKENNIQLIELFLEKNVDYDQLNNFGQTAFQLAYENGFTEICDRMTNFIMRVQNSSQNEKEQSLDSLIEFSDQIKQKYVSTNQDFTQERQDKRIFKEVFVHLDFKGAPPTFAFFKKFIQFMGERYNKLVTGFILELEDTFPYEGFLSSLKGLNFYTREQLLEIQELMKKYKFQMIPLVQTFGHLEFALKRERFSHLRESNDNFQSICPLKNESKDFVLNMIDQNVKLFGSDNLQYIHLGADEVFNLASCQDCQFFAEEAGKSLLYNNFVIKICKAVKKKYPNLNILIWDDMFRNNTYSDLASLKPNNQPIFQPCVWAYPGNSEYFQQTIKNQALNNLCLEFKKVWAASCFRGSCEPSSTMTDFNERLYNHKLWIDKIRSNPCSQQAIQGIIITGWARFSHETVLSELLCMSVPSLCMCLAVIEKQQLNINVIYKEMVNYLNLKGRTILNGVNEILQTKDLQTFQDYSPFIDEKREKYFCNDAFEICWNISKAHALLKQTKKTLKDSSVLNHDKIMKRQNLFVMQQYQKFSEKCRIAIQGNDESMNLEISSFYDEDFTSGDSLNSERLNPNIRNKILEYLRASIKLLKRSVILSDKILPKYMFSKDIEEFKNSKILKYLHQAFMILEGLTERTRQSIINDRQMFSSSQIGKRISQTPDVMSSPLLDPVKPQLLGTDIKNFSNFPKLNDVIVRLNRITSLNDGDLTNQANFSSASSIQRTQEFLLPQPEQVFKIPQPPRHKNKLPKNTTLILKKNASSQNNNKIHIAPKQTIINHLTQNKKSSRPSSFNHSIPSEEEKSSIGKKRNQKILRKRMKPNQATMYQEDQQNEIDQIQLMNVKFYKNKKPRFQVGAISSSLEENKQE